MDYKSNIAKLIKIDGLTENDVASMMMNVKDITMGDYCLPCFRFSKTLRKAPQLIAEEIASTIDLSLAPYLSKVEAVAGYLNFTVNKAFFAQNTIDRILKEGEAYGEDKVGEGKTICIDYSSVNIAKPFHIGHLLTTVIGGALYRIYKKLGYTVVGINHLGDWGTQFGKLISAYKRWGTREQIEKGSIRALLDLYVKFHDEAEKDPALEEEGRYYFKKIEDGDKEALELFMWFKDVTLREVGKVYDRLGIKFDSYAGESFYNDKMDAPLRELKDKGLLVESDGAEVVQLDDYDMPPCLLRKADGATLYATRDIAAAIYRKNTYDFDKCLYVVAYQQNLHFKQFFKVIDLMGHEWAKDLVHVAFGMVSLLDDDGNPVSLSTRHGRVVFLEEVLDNTVRKAKSIIEQKNPDLEGKDEIAEKIGVGAVIYSALYASRIKDMTFSYDRVLNFDGETGPYVQYTYARCNAVLQKAPVNDSAPDYSALSSIEADELVRLLERYPQVIKEAGEKYEPSMVTRLVTDIASQYNKFYYQERIIGGDKGAEKARLNLTKATMQVIYNAFELLGIKTVDRM